MMLPVGVNFPITCNSYQALKGRQIYCTVASHWNGPKCYGFAMFYSYFVILYIYLYQMKISVNAVAGKSTLGFSLNVINYTTQMSMCWSAI